MPSLLWSSKPSPCQKQSLVLTAAKKPLSQAAPGEESRLPTGRWQSRRPSKNGTRQRKEDRKMIKRLKAEGRRKDRVLAETTSLPVLSKARHLLRQKPKRR